MSMNNSEDPQAPKAFVPDAETLADVESLDYKHCTLTDPAHKLQTRSGAVAGMVLGGAIGTVTAGPIGALIGGIVGGISGGIGGKVVGEMVDPSGEVEYWIAHHAAQSFVKNNSSYADYEPAYSTGYNNYTPGESFEQAEPDLIKYYQDHSGDYHLSWEEARPAAKAAWDRLALIFPLEKMNQY